MMTWNFANFFLLRKKIAKRSIWLFTFNLNIFKCCTKCVNCKGYISHVEKPHAQRFQYSSSHFPHSLSYKILEFFQNDFSKYAPSVSIFFHIQNYPKRHEFAQSKKTGNSHQLFASQHNSTVNIFICFFFLPVVILQCFSFVSN